MSLSPVDVHSLSESGIDGRDPGKYAALLDDLQGNIIKANGRNHSVLLFVRWRADRLDRVRGWISAFATGWITSARQQFQEAQHFRERGEPGPVFGGLYLSRLGYEALGLVGAALPSDQPFRMGMRHDELAAMLGDPPLQNWEPGYQEAADALVLLAEDDLIALLQVVNRVCQELRSCAEILHREDGFVLRNERGQAIEHFGYVDGLSQPLFESQDIRSSQQSDGGFSRWDPRAPLSLVLVRDPNGQHEDSYGSYLVVRKLEQNVKQFNASVNALAATINVSEELAGAYTIGRFKDGSLVCEAATANQHVGNNFNFAADPEASRCPFHAHIRKANPRGDSVRAIGVSDEEERGHRIVRRAWSYGSSRREDEPETGSGLLFLCFQASIENQFNFIQTRWANAANFVRVGTGPDPLIGQPQGKQQWPLHWGQSEKRGFDFNLWVQFKGGDYFFAPSISFLRSLAP